MKNNKRFLVLAFIGVLYFFSAWAYKPFNSFYYQEGGDAFGYYVYLPAFFIHHDLADLHTTMAAKFSHSAPGKKAEGDFSNKYFMGTAVLQAPFFLGAHVLAGWLHQPQDGFSMPYLYAVQISEIIYSLLALFIIGLILRGQFNDSVTAVVIFIIGAGTNLYYLAVEQAPFCHAYLLFWYSLLVLFTIRFYSTCQRRYILLTGLVCGMIILTRLNEFYAVLIPLAWGIRTKKDIADRWKLLRPFSLYILAGVIVMMLCVVPQLLYWKVSSGHYLYYSYTGEHFDFAHPRIWDGLFSFNNGWLIYSPVMFVALGGIWLVWKGRDASFGPLAIYLPVHMYVIYSWWCWVYMGSYGSRPMTEAYALLSIPMAYSVEWFGRSGIRMFFMVLVTGFCVFLVLLQTYQSDLGIFNSELSNWHFNAVTFGKTKLSYEESIVLDTKEFQPSHPAYIKVLGQNDYEDSLLTGSNTSVATSGRRSVCVGPGSTSIGYEATLSETGAKPGQWIRSSINCLAKLPTNHNWHLSSLVIMFERSGKMTKWRSVGLQNKINNPERRIWNFPVNEWGRVYFYSQVPDGMTASDHIKVYVEHKYGPDVYVDDLKVELYEEK